MAWTMYRVTLRLLSPLHVGHFKQGNVQRTRPYVTGRALCGALTARLTRDNPNLGSNYQNVGEQVNQQLAFSYFFPSTEKDKVTLFPWDDPDQFTCLYLNTYASTALDYTRNTALEGSLHETEYIAPVTREGEPVYLVGFLFEKSGCSLNWRDALNRLQLGGERTYGWGRVRLAGKPEQPPSFWPGWQVNLDGTRPTLQASNGTSPRAYAHVQVDGVTARGPLEPLVGRETKNANQHGETLSSAVICWAPGSQIQHQSTLQIDSFGLWKPSPPAHPTNRLPDRPTTQLTDYPTTRLPDHPTNRLPDYPTTRLPDYPTTRLTDYPTNRLPD